MGLPTEKSDSAGQKRKRKKKSRRELWKREGGVYCVIVIDRRAKRERAQSAKRERKGSMIDRFCFLAPKCRRRQGLHTWLSPVSGKQSGFISWGGSLYNVGDYGSPFSTQLALLLINFALSLYSIFITILFAVASSSREGIVSSIQKKKIDIPLSSSSAAISGRMRKRASIVTADDDAVREFGV